MQLTARGAQKTRNESRKLSMYSKQWAPGDTLRVFYPIFWVDGKPEINVGALYGHNVSDIKALGLKTAFIPSQTKFDESGVPVGPTDITYQFSQIARAFVDGQKAIDEANVMKKQWPSEAARKEALKDIETKYDAKNNMKAVKPIIGKVQFYISTEVVSIKLMNGQPATDTIAVTSMPLSNQKIDQIYNLMSDPKYAPQPGDDYFEVEWKYPVHTDKGQSAKAATPNGLTAEYRFSTAYPDAWTNIVSAIGSLARDDESIVRRATSKVDPQKVLNKLKNYTFMHSECLDAAPEESVELLCKNCLLIKELDVMRTLQSNELIDSLKAALAEYETTHPLTDVNVPEPNAGSIIPDLQTAVANNAANEVTNPTTVPENPLPDLTLQPGAPTVHSLMGGNTMSDSELEEVDLDDIV